MDSDDMMENSNDKPKASGSDKEMDETVLSNEDNSSKMADNEATKIVTATPEEAQLNKQKKHN